LNLLILVDFGPSCFFNDYETFLIVTLDWKIVN